MERRLQDLQRQFENSHRLGEVVDVKYENERWFVKMNDGDNKQPSGSGEGDGQTFRSDWLPWQGSSHGTIKSSNPPRKGMKVQMNSPGGQAELAHATPFHYDPNNPSPHGKQDEIVHLVEDADEEKQDGGSSSGGGASSGSGGSSGSGQGGQQQDKWNTWHHYTKNKHHLIITNKQEDNQSGSGSGDAGGGSSTGGGGAGDGASGGESGGEKPKQKSRKLPEIEEDGKEKTLQVKSFYDDQSSQGQGGAAGGGSAGGSSGGSSGSSDSQDKKLTHLLTVGKKKAKVKATEKEINVWMGDKKAQINMTEDKTEVMHGDKKSKIVMTKDDITISYGGDEGKTSWKMSDKKLEIGMGDVKWTLSDKGWRQDSGKVQHNNSPIGDDHVHKNTQPGGGESGAPKDTPEI
jgi:hypothetical protein